MKVIELYIGDHRVLRDLTVNFGVFDGKAHLTNKPRRYAIDFLVGVNGTGKSTLLRFLARIFYELERSGLQNIRTQFRLKYVVHASAPIASEETVLIEHKQDGDGIWRTDYQINGQGVAGIEERHQPARIVVLTTGEESDWLDLRDGTNAADAGSDEALNLTRTERYREEIPGHLPRPTTTEEPDADARSSTSKFLFVESEQLPLVTLCGLLVHEAERQSKSLADDLDTGDSQGGPLGLILEECNIKDVVGFSMRCRVFNELTTSSQKELVEGLRKQASRVVVQGADLLLVFMLDNRAHEIVQSLLPEEDGQGNGLALLEHLYPLTQRDEYGNQVLQDVDIFLRPYPEQAEDQNESDAAAQVNPEGRPPIYMLKWLSDGEKTFLGRMCLLSLLDKANTLALLDEPEVHFNDYWKRRIVKLLSSVMRDREVHAIITTHSSIALTDVPKKDVVLLKRPGLYTRRSEEPPMETFAADPSDIIVHVFDAPFAAGQYGVEEVIDLLQGLETETVRQRENAKLQLQAILDDRKIAPGYFRFRVRERLHRLSQTN